MVVLKSSGQSILIISIVMLTLATVAVALRMVSKARTNNKIAVEDYVIVLALLFFGAYTGVLLQCVLHNGGSLDETELALPQIEELLKSLYVTELLFGATITSVKMSIIFYYRNMFPIAPYSYAVLGMGITCIVWFIITVFITIFQCKPVEAVWNLLLVAEGAKCMPFGGFIFGYELSNMLIDFVLLCLPIRVVWQLQMPQRQKIMVAGIFVLGGFVIVTCILRIVYLYHPGNDQNVSLPGGMTWSTIELGVAIICACLPTYRALVSRGSIFPSKLKAWYSSLVVSIQRSRGSSRQESLSSGPESKEPSHYNEPWESATLPAYVDAEREKSRGEEPGIFTISVPDRHDSSHV